MEPDILDMGAAYTNDRNSSINTGKDLAGQLFSVTLGVSPVLEDHKGQ